MVLTSIVAAVLGVLALLASPAAGLERVSQRSGDGPAWAGASSVTVAYYNTCNDWFWIGVPDPGDQYGVVFDSPHPGAVLLGCDMLQYGLPHASYGYSATVAVHPVDGQDCPTGAPLASSAYIPAWQDGWWGAWAAYALDVAVPDRFAITVTFHGWGRPAAPPRVVWDSPNAGPTGPPACGVCYPAPRLPRSFWFYSGASEQRFCPGWPFDHLPTPDCPLEFVWRARFEGSVGVEPVSWARVKSLYR